MKSLTFYFVIVFSFFISGTVHALTVSELVKSCLNGTLGSCESAGSAYEHGTDVAVDYLKASEYYNIGCTGGHGRACRKLSNLYIDGRGVLKSLDEAWRLQRLACEHSDFYSCNFLGTTYERGFPLTRTSYAPPDPLKASQFYEFACEGNYALSCVNLAALYANGAGVVQNTTKAKVLYKKACDLGEDFGCKGLERLNKPSLMIPFKLKK